MEKKIAICPVCRSELKHEIMRGSQDELVFRCENCEKYAISFEFFEDHFVTPDFQLDLAVIAAYLKSHKRGKRIPCICEHENPRYNKYYCITIGNMRK